MKIATIGSGAWGTALTQQLANKGYDCLIYGVEPSQIDDINQNHQNSFFFPDVPLNPNIRATLQLEEIQDADVVLFAVPSKAMESVAKQVDSYLNHPVIVINVAKGFFPGTNERMSEVLERCLSKEHVKSITSVIGPSFAEEVVQNQITTVNAVSKNIEDAQYVQQLLSSDTFRVYASDDLIGSETASSIKNIMALASGMAEGLGLGTNAKAGLITRGLAEMTRFGVALGADERTFLGLTGVGDLVLTCTSKQSRNYSAGYQIGKDDTAEHFWANNTKTVEGVGTCDVIYHYGKEIGVDTPIIDEMYRILYEKEKPSVCLKRLMGRSLKDE